ncbi:ABC-2 family transporter protein [Rhodospirillaceae bacterium SYSU D60014]|uniref:ABC transporter permease n=1 Tax=Virgifigura deserti TaxID=2268457 RepID=UPI000E6654CF
MIARRLRLVRTLLGTAAAEMAEYRVSVLVWILTGTAPLIMMMIWMGLAEAGPMGGYSATDFAAYFLIVFLVRQVTVAWVYEELDREIRLGEMSPRLLRPFDPYWMFAAQHLTVAGMHLTIALPVALLGFAVTGAILPLRPDNLAFFAVAVAGAWVIRFNMLYCVGLLAFWTDQAAALGNLIFTLYIVLGGALVPLDLFPAPVQQILAFLPFAYILNFPVQILLGNLPGPALLQGFVVQILWILLFIGLRQLLWRRGLRQYAAVGA